MKNMICFTLLVMVLVLVCGVAFAQIYVSNEGTNTNPGTEAEPVLTLVRAINLTTNGDPGVLLRRGDVFDEIATVYRTNTAEAPFVVGAYGQGAQPQVTRLRMAGANVIFDNLHFLPRRGTDYGGWEKLDSWGVQVNGPLDGGTIQNCTFEYCGLGLQSISEQSQNIYILNNRIRRSYNHGRHAQGIFASDVDGLTISGNLLDHNGWWPEASAGPTIFNHNIYVRTNNTGIVIRDNVIARGASHGIQQKGGVTEGNLLVGNAIGISYGNQPGSIVGNVLLGATDIHRDSGELPRGWGFEIGNVDELEVSGNILAHPATKSGIAHRPGIQVTVTNDRPLGVQNTQVIHNTLYNMRGILVDDRDTGLMKNVKVFGNLLYWDKDHIWNGDYVLNLCAGTMYLHNRISSASPQPWVLYLGVPTEHPDTDLSFADPARNYDYKWLDALWDRWGGADTAREAIQYIKDGFKLLDPARGPASR